MNKIREWINIQSIKNPRRVVLVAILLFNIFFILLASIVISSLSLSGTEEMSLFEAAFCTISMILDAGCIQYVVADIGTSGVIIVLICLLIVLVGMISFTGAVIGYTTNYISSFIDNANSGKRKLKLSGHSIILNWNSRASEIINDMLYCDSQMKVAVLVNSRKDEIEKEINERMADTIARENKIIYEKSENMPFFQRLSYRKRNSFKKNVTVIIREGDVFSAKQLHDISLETANMIIVLGNDINNSVCKFEQEKRLSNNTKGNSQTIKTLMQVADITAAEYSNDNQKIIVEITDDWTESLVERIIMRKQVSGKCNIVPVRVNKVLGHILSQFSLMPELNMAYRELFSNKGATFYAVEEKWEDEIKYIEEYLQRNNTALPLTFMKEKDRNYAFFSSDHLKDIHKKGNIQKSDYKVALNKDYWIERKNVVILGHNSRCTDIMRGFMAFRNEWQYADKSREILRIVVIDTIDNLEKMNFYKDYPFVIKTVCADIYDREIICNTISTFVSENKEDTSILILSDDTALNEDIDANALANLVYVQDIIREKKLKNPDFDEHSIDVVVEIINPKHHDIVNSYSVNNVVISNRYISKMISQIGEKEALFDFYSDILTYDSGNDGKYESKEIYIKKVSRFFNELPGPCTAEELVRAVYNASVEGYEKGVAVNPAIVLGYVKNSSEMVLFSGDQSKIHLELDITDKLIVFSNH